MCVFVVVFFVVWCRARLKEPDRARLKEPDRARTASARKDKRKGKGIGASY